MSPATLALMVWGTVVGLDLITGPQVMIARPVVAGTVAGWLVGDPVAGMTVGVVFECFALHVMPFGAARYADYGIGAVVAVPVAAGAPGVLGIGIAAGWGLLVAEIGGWGIQRVREGNTRDVARHAAAIDAGDWPVIRAVHLRGIVRDGVRAAGLSLGGVALGSVVRTLVSVEVGTAVLAGLATIGVALGTVSAAGWRLAAGARGGLVALGLGLVGGAVWVMA